MKLNRKKLWRSRIALMMMLQISCGGCETQNNLKFIAPPFPEPHAHMADELEKVCMPQEKCPFLWEWIDRLYKLKDQLKAMS